ncbi:MAG: ABC transporter ATP-binding protein [Synergistaceae bacterium]|jgi:peptide/nickel transport system ATP-binding protein|nr:ABC transporter ATP-binding protein [Synergistaceae bacterium]
MDKVKILEIKDLTIQYTTDMECVKAVNHISLTLNKNETLGLVGETGAGKTTTALGIIQLIPEPPGKITSGEILFNGEDLLKKSEDEMSNVRGGQISMIFQDPMTSLNPVLTVGNQIMEVIQLHSKFGKHEAEAEAMRMLELVGISRDRFHEYPHQFSGGMKQRVVIAIAIACNPMLLIADEPTTALDVTIQFQVLQLISALKEKLHTSMLLITHDLGVVAETCDRVAIIYAGEIVEVGVIKEIFENARHPYTIGLFKSIPQLDDEKEQLEAIEGLMPDPSDLPDGCKFAPRCPERRPECELSDWDLYNVAEDHKVRCIMYKPPKEGSR